MLVNITTRNLVLSDEQRDLIHRRIEFALGRFSARISSVSAVFSDINGPRGGIDKKCQLRISLVPHGEVIVDDSNTSVEAVVANVADRASNTLARSIERSRDHQVEVERAIASTNPPITHRGHRSTRKSRLRTAAPQV